MPKLKYSFSSQADLDRYYWQSYDYTLKNPSNPDDGGTDRATRAIWNSVGPIAGVGSASCDDSMWGIDYPDDKSILAIQNYRICMAVPSGRTFIPLYLKDASMEVFLRGDSLDLKNGKVNFFVQCDCMTTNDFGIAICNEGKYRSRWHLRQPLFWGSGEWKANNVKIENDVNKWKLTWASAPLDVSLSQVYSFGFSFRGCDSKATGRFSIAELSFSW